MEELGNRVTSVRRIIGLLAALARFTWVANGLIGLASLACHRYEFASVAGYVCVISVFLAAYAHRAASQLANLEQVIQSRPSPRSLVAVDTVS